MGNWSLKEDNLIIAINNCLLSFSNGRRLWNSSLQWGHGTKFSPFSSVNEKIMTNLTAGQVFIKNGPLFSEGGS